MEQPKPKRGRPKKVITDVTVSVKPARQKVKVGEPKDTAPKQPVGRPPIKKPIYIDHPPLRSASVSLLGIFCLNCFSLNTEHNIDILCTILPPCFSLG